MAPITYARLAGGAQAQRRKQPGRDRSAFLDGAGQLALGPGRPRRQPRTGYLAAGSLLLLSIALHRRWRLPAGEATDLRPRQLPELKLAFPFDREARPVMVLIEYRVPFSNASGRWRRSGMSVSVTVPGAGTCFRTPPMPSTGARRRVPIDQVAEPDGLTDPVWGTLDLTE